MDVRHRASPISFRFDLSVHPLSRIARLATSMSAAIVLCLCVLVLIRGLLGAFEAPVYSILLVVAAVMAELLASVFRLLWRWLHPAATRRSALLIRLVVPSICVSCVAIAISMTRANGVAVASLWLVFAGGEFAWWFVELRALRERARQTAAAVIRSGAPEAVQDYNVQNNGHEEFDANVIQQITRSRNDEGVEIISGILRAELASGQRSDNLHVAFCPPLAYEPTVSAHQLDGSPLDIKIGQAEVFGSRIELRRGAVAQPSERVTIYFEVRPR